ncbi:MAG: DoxX family protein [Caldilineaceae bacterium]
MKNAMATEFITSNGTLAPKSRNVGTPMRIGLWILQILLAVMFLFHGWIMIFSPAELVAIMNSQFAPWFRLFVGVTESLGALGLLLPGITRIWTWLTAWAGVGLMIVAVSTCVLHASRGETSSAITAAILFGLLAFVTYMRWETNLTE